MLKSEVREGRKLETQGLANAVLHDDNLWWQSQHYTGHAQMERHKWHGAERRDQFWTKPCVGQVWQQPHIAASQAVPEFAGGERWNEKEALAETASPLRNPAFWVPSSYSHGQNTLYPQVFGEQPNAVPLRSPTYLSLTHIGSRSTLRLTKLPFPGKNALPQTLSNCVCRLAGSSFWGFHTKKQIWKKYKPSKRSKTLKAVAI